MSGSACCDIAKSRKSGVVVLLRRPPETKIIVLPFQPHYLPASGGSATTPLVMVLLRRAILPVSLDVRSATSEQEEKRRD